MRAAHPGEPAACLLVTNVINQVLPLIRYTLTDAVTLLEGPNPDPWTGWRIVVSGRREDAFVYPGGVVVPPQVFARSTAGFVTCACWHLGRAASASEVPSAFLRWITA
jgi:phenylacetate-coenzyme A ligase PaaK-like adenylate-forming protein